MVCRVRLLQVLSLRNQASLYLLGEAQALFVSDLFAFGSRTWQSCSLTCISATWFASADVVID